MHWDDARLWLLLVIAFVWSYRAKRALLMLRDTPVIRPTQNPPPLNPRVTIVIPAKNEENNIADCVQRFLNQDYPQLEIIVVNDRSTDQTRTVLERFKDRITIIDNSPTPEGWTGKNFAIHSGIAKATGDWLLFTDADTRHEPVSVRAALTHALQHKIELLTLLPRCIAHGFLENAVQPLAMALMGLWFPIEKTNDPKSNTHFGNGQFLMISKKLYHRIGGHAAVKGEFLEDFAFMKAAKALKAKAQCALGVPVYGTRMYDSFGAMWRGWRRIFLHAFERKPLPLLRACGSVLIFSVFPFAYFPFLTSYAWSDPLSHGLLWGAWIPILAFIFGVSWKGYSIVKGKAVYALLHPAAAVVAAGILLDAFKMAVLKSKTFWR